MIEDSKSSWPSGEGNSGKLSEVIMSLAISHHNRANNLIGICIIILTFYLGVTLQFGGLNNILLQITIALIVVQIALFMRASFYYSLYETAFIASHDAQHAGTDLRRADTSMRAALILMHLNPAFMTWALGIYWVAVLGFSLSILFLATYAREQRRHKVLWPSHGLRYLES